MKKDLFKFDPEGCQIQPEVTRAYRTSKHDGESIYTLLTDHNYYPYLTGSHTALKQAGQRTFIINCEICLN